MKNAANENQVKEAASRAQRGRERELSDLRVVLSSRDGRRFFWRLLEITGVFKSSFTGSSETFFREGSRNMGLLLMADLNEADPEKYLTMMTEAKQDS